MTAGAYDTSQNGGYDVFAAKMNAAGTALLYSTFLGGIGNETGFALAVDPSGNAVLTGETWSSDFPTTAGACDTSHNDYYDVFVTKLNATGTAVIYSTFLGGGQYDVGLALALDPSGSACLTGYTFSGGFPRTAGAYDTTPNGNQEVFVTKLNPTGTALIYSTFLGGSDYDYPRSLALDPAGNACLTGCTNSGNFPTTAGAYDTTFNGGAFDVFVTKLNASGTALLYSTFLGGSSDDRGYAIALDSAGSACVAGYTASPEFPTTPDSYDTSHNGGSDVFVAKFVFPPGTLQGRVTFLGRTSHKDYVKFTLKDTATGVTLVYDDILTQLDGSYSLADVPSGSYAVQCYSPEHLTRIVSPVTVPAGGTAIADFLDVKGGDLNDDNWVNALDLGGFSGSYGGRGEPLP